MLIKIKYQCITVVLDCKRVKKNTALQRISELLGDKRHVRGAMTQTCSVIFYEFSSIQKSISLHTLPVPVI